MFGGILTKVLGGSLVAVLALCGYLYLSRAWQKANYAKQVQELQAELIGTRIDKERLSAELDAAKRTAKVKTRVNHESSKADKVISGGDAGPVIDMFRQLREKGRLSDTPVKGKGGS